MDVNTAMTVGELNMQIGERFGTTVANQALYIGSTKLRDGLPLHEYNIQTDSLIYVEREL